MGYGFSVECSNCGFTKHFNIGIGFADSCLDNIAETLHGSLKREVKEIMDNHSVREYEFDRLLVRCNQCGVLSVMEMIKIYYDKGEVFENSLTCSNCEKPLEVINESTPLDSISCPHCQEKTLSKSAELLWD